MKIEFPLKTARFRKGCAFITVLCELNDPAICFSIVPKDPSSEYFVIAANAVVCLRICRP